MNPTTVVMHQLRMGDVVLAIALFLLLSWLLCQGLAWSGRLRRPSRLDRYRQLAWQVGILLVLEQAYELSRGLIPHEADVAFPNAYRLLDLEWSHGLFIESRVEHFFLQFGALMNAVDLFYVACHVVVTIGVLAWIYLCRRQYYPSVRNLLMLTTGIALVAFYAYPTAPPRLLANYGFVDPLQLHHLVGAGGSQPDSYTYNPYAAMPSLHVAYAIIAGWALVVAESRWVVRILGSVYPFVMAAVVIISGNHWVLDVVGAFVTVGLAWLLLTGFSRVSGSIALRPLPVHREHREPV